MLMDDDPWMWQSGRRSSYVNPGKGESAQRVVCFVKSGKHILLRVDEVDVGAFALNLGSIAKMEPVVRFEVGEEEA